MGLKVSSEGAELSHLGSLFHKVMEHIGLSWT